jgi:hypothetical protein
MVITRCNTPYRLTVAFDGITYEGDEAQSLIYQQIGKNFEIAGYIQQKGENSFLGMTPADKLRFLEKVAFSDVPIDEIKEKAREFVSTTELTLSSIQGELKYLQDNPVSQPEKFAYTQEQIKSSLSAARNTISLLTAARERTEKEKLQQHLLKEKKASLSQRIADIKTDPIPEPIQPDGEEEELKLHTQYDDYQREKKGVADLEGYLQRNQQEIDRLTQSLEQLILATSEEKKETQTELEDMTTSLREYTTQQEHKCLIASFSKERYDTLTVSIPQAEEQLRVLLQSREARVCPGCKIHLRVMSNTLEVFGGAVAYSAEKERELKAQIAEQKKELTTLEVLKRQIDRLPPMGDEIELDPTSYSLYSLGTC